MPRGRQRKLGGAVDGWAGDGNPGGAEGGRAWTRRGDVAPPSNPRSRCGALPCRWSGALAASGGAGRSADRRPGLLLRPVASRCRHIGCARSSRMRAIWGTLPARRLIWGHRACRFVKIDTGMSRVWACERLDDVAELAANRAWCWAVCVRTWRTLMAPTRYRTVAQLARFAACRDVCRRRPISPGGALRRELGGGGSLRRGAL